MPGAFACATSTGPFVGVIASRISGLIGTLGEDYPGYFTPQDDVELAEVLLRAERDEPFRESLRDRCSEASALVKPEREREGWCDLLAELAA